jgi:DNA-directed RNA polymerase subunit RPC12/RpoP
MDISFHCPHCKQELAVEATAAGSAIVCPTCNTEITVPEVDVSNVHPVNPMASSAAAKIERHFSVPVHDAPAEILIKKDPRAAETEGLVPGREKRVRIKIFRHTDCIEVGHDRYEEIVGNFLNKVGEANIISINTLGYTHIDIGSQKILTDYAIQIIYRG